jgi:hypothetical protein
LDLEKAAARANQIGSFDNPWLLFSTYIDAINKQCEDEMLPKWESRLGGAEIFMSTHCFTMSESGRVDPTVQALLQNSTGERKVKTMEYLTDLATAGISPAKFDELSA